MLCDAHALFGPCMERRQNRRWKTRVLLDCVSEENLLAIQSQILKMSETKTERGTLWGGDEVMALIEIWTDEGIQQQRNLCTRKQPIFENIARRLQEEGEYIRTFIQVREKNMIFNKNICLVRFIPNNKFSPIILSVACQCTIHYEEHAWWH